MGAITNFSLGGNVDSSERDGEGGGGPRKEKKKDTESKTPKHAILSKASSPTPQPVDPWVERREKKNRQNRTRLSEAGRSLCVVLRLSRKEMSAQDKPSARKKKTRSREAERRRGM